jgi:hypothetical protein
VHHVVLLPRGGVTWLILREGGVSYQHRMLLLRLLLVQHGCAEGKGWWWGRPSSASSSSSS